MSATDLSPADASISSSPEGSVAIPTAKASKGSDGRAYFGATPIAEVSVGSSSLEGRAYFEATPVVEDSIGCLGLSSLPRTKTRCKQGFKNNAMLNSELDNPAKNTTNNSTASPDAKTDESTINATTHAKSKKVPTSEQPSKKASTKEEFKAEIETMEYKYKLLCGKVERYQKEAKEFEFRFKDFLSACDLTRKSIHELKDDNYQLLREKDTLIQIIGQISKLSKNKSLSHQ